MLSLKEMPHRRFQAVLAQLSGFSRDVLVLDRLGIVLPEMPIMEGLRIVSASTSEQGRLWAAGYEVQTSTMERHRYARGKDPDQAAGHR